MHIRILSRRLFWLAGVLLLVGSLVGAGAILNHSAAQPSAEASRPPATLAPEKVVCLGYVDVEPGVASLYPVQQGRVDWVIAEGSTVAKSDPILKLDERAARQRLAEARADLAAAASAVAQAELLEPQHEKQIAQQLAARDAAKASEEAATKEWEAENRVDKSNPDAKPSLKEQAIKAVLDKMKSLRQVEEAKLAALMLQKPELTVERAKADVQAKKARLEQAQIAVDECVLRAPSDGTVLRVLVSAGEVLAGAPRAAAIQFAPKGQRVIRAEVLQEWAHRVQVGQPAKIEDDTRTVAAHWQGKVKRISDWYTQRRNILQEPFQYNDVRTLECLVEVEENPKHPLRIGQRVRVTFE